MKSYLITIIIRDGDHEYADKTILDLTDEQAEEPTDILSLWKCVDEKPTEIHSAWYEFEGFDYRHYQVYHIQEIIKPEDKPILHSYGIY